MKARSISNLIATLIVIAIAVGVAVAVATLIPNIMSKTTPKKGVINLVGSEATYDPNSGTIWIEIRGEYTGSETATITGVSVTSGTTTLPLTPLSPLGSVRPGSYVKIVLRGTASFSAPPSKILVTVNYCFSDNTCYQSSELAPLRIG